MFYVLNDSSTDISVTDEELVYVRYLEDGRPVTKFLSIQALGKADAVGIVAGLGGTGYFFSGIHEQNSKASCSV